MLVGLCVHRSLSIHSVIDLETITAMCCGGENMDLGIKQIGLEFWFSHL